MSYAKALVGALIAALGVLVTGAVDDSLSLQETLSACLAAAVAFAGVWATPNTPRR